MSMPNKGSPCDNLVSSIWWVPIADVSYVPVSCLVAYFDLFYALEYFLKPSALYIHSNIGPFFGKLAVRQLAHQEYTIRRENTAIIYSFPGSA